MRIFCSYAFTGESASAVTKRMRRIVDTLTDQGHGVYCQLFDPSYPEMTNVSQWVNGALYVMNDYEVVLVINTSERRSEGMLIEFGAALARGKKIIYAQHESSVGMTYVPELADTAFVWSDENELIKKIIDAVTE